MFSRRASVPPWVMAAVIAVLVAGIVFAFWKSTSPRGGDMALPKEEVARRFQMLNSQLHPPGGGNGPAGPGAPGH